MRTILFGFAFLSIMMLSNAHAAPQKETKGLSAEDVPSKIITMNFDGRTIQGSTENPGGEIFTGRTPTQFSKLFTLRDNWKKKMAKSVNSL